MKLLLFDIDGTIVRSGSFLGKAHERAFIDGFAAAYGLDMASDILSHGSEYSGRTDMFIAKDLLRRRGLTAGAIDRGIMDMFRAMEESFIKQVRASDYRDCTIGGVREIITELGAMDNCVLGLLTGNVYGIAQAKMKAIGLEGIFRLGGFGDSSEDRSDLVGIAIADGIRKNLFNEPPYNSDIFVIGDTKNDVKCAKANNVVSVALASGTASTEELRRYSPDYLFESMAKLPEIIKK